MSQTFDDGDKRILTDLAHWMLWLLGAYVLSRVAYWLNHESVLFAFAASIALLAFLVAHFTALVHQQSARLCIRCMREVPANAQEQAQGWRRRVLWWEHRSLKMVLVSLVIVVFLLERLHYSIPADALFTMITCVNSYGLWLHHRLRPWCPYCRRWDDGGDHVVVPDPAEGERFR